VGGGYDGFMPISGVMENRPSFKNQSDFVDFLCKTKREDRGVQRDLINEWVAVHDNNVLKRNLKELNAIMSATRIFSLTCSARLTCSLILVGYRSNISEIFILFNVNLKFGVIKKILKR
jgi:hypothetical protein